MHILLEVVCFGSMATIIISFLGWFCFVFRFWPGNPKKEVFNLEDFHGKMYVK